MPHFCMYCNLAIVLLLDQWYYLVTVYEILFNKKSVILDTFQSSINESVNNNNDTVIKEIQSRFLHVKC